MNNLKEKVIDESTSGQEVLQHTILLAGTIEKISQQLEDKLAPILMQPSPVASLKTEDKQFPPYFDSLQQQLYRIKHSLIYIESLITRIDI